MYCIKCGKELNTESRQPDGSVACPVCGTVYRPRTAQNSERSLNNFHENNQSQSDDAHSSSIPIASSQRRKANNKRNNNKKKGSDNKVPFIFLLVVAALVVFGYFYFTGKLNFSSKGTIDPNMNVIAVTPDQSAPKNSGSQTTQKSSFLYNFRVIDDDMLNLEVGVNTHLCFTVQCSTPSSAVIDLIRVDTNETIGKMKDDGKGEDAVAGDGVYTYGINVNGAVYGKVVYAASYNGAFSNESIIRFYQKITEENLASAETMLLDVYSISSTYSNGNDYFTEGNVENIDLALDATEVKIQEWYLQGKISEYNRDEYSVYFKDAISGIPMIYSPFIEGTKGAGDETTITAFYPYASDGMAMDATQSAIYMLDTEFDHISFNTKDQYSDGAVTPDKFVSSLGKNQVIFWDGHGGYNSKVHSYLVTGKRTNDFYELFHYDDFQNDRILLAGGDRIAITSKYIDKYCGDLSGSFIFVSSCHSIQDTTLAASFLNKGASVYCGFTETVYIIYERAIIKEFFTNMTRVNPDSGKYYTVMESLQRTVPYVSYTDNQYFDLKYPDAKVDPKNSATLGFLGNPDYRFAEFGLRRITASPSIVPHATPTSSPTPQSTAVPQIDLNKFNLKGTWKSVGSYGFGQAQPGALVTFDGTYCNFYSPRDTYALYQNNGKLTFDVTSFLFRENLTFEVQIVDDNNIKIIYDPSHITELKRVGK